MHIDLAWPEFCKWLGLAGSGWQGKPEGRAGVACGGLYADLRELQTVIYTMESHRVLLTMGMK